MHWNPSGKPIYLSDPLPPPRKLLDPRMGRIYPMHTTSTGLKLSHKLLL